MVYNPSEKSDEIQFPLNCKCLDDRTRKKNKDISIINCFLCFLLRRSHTSTLFFCRMFILTLYVGWRLNMIVGRRWRRNISHLTCWSLIQDVPVSICHKCRKFYVKVYRSKKLKAKESLTGFYNKPK